MSYRGNIDTFERVKSSPDLGKVPDVQLASFYGVSRSMVHRARKAKNVPAFRPQTNTREEFMELRKKIRADKRCGVWPDSQLAKVYKVSRSFVRSSRIGIKHKPIRTKQFTWLNHNDLTGIMDAWKRPPGMDAHLEYLREQKCTD